jgi:hypothetical protein
MKKKWRKNMGAAGFDNVVWINNIDTAFRKIVEEAEYDHGHSGYTGTIAEKTHYEIRSKHVFKSVESAEDYATVDLNDNDHDKWGPAWAIRIEDPINGKGWLFYGMASS